MVRLNIVSDVSILFESVVAISRLEICLAYLSDVREATSNAAVASTATSIATVTVTDKQ